MLSVVAASLLAWSSVLHKKGKKATLTAVMFSTVAVLQDSPFTLAIKTEDGSLRSPTRFELSVGHAEVILQKDDVYWLRNALAFKLGRQSFSQPPLLRQVVLEHGNPASLAVIYPGMVRRIHFACAEDLSELLAEALELVDFDFGDYTASDVMTALHMARLRDENSGIDDRTEATLFRVFGLPVPVNRALWIRQAEAFIDGNPMAKIIKLEKAIKRFMAHFV